MTLHRTLLLHKPAGYVCSQAESGLRVVDLLPKELRLQQPAFNTVGRLDKDTTGLLLLTTDGALLHRLTHPKHHLPKTYMVTLADPLRGDEAVVFASGTLMLRGETKPLRPAQLVPTGTHTATLTLHEGRYHQIKRMFGAVGNRVVGLHRAQFGALTLDGLTVGQWRELTATELAALNRAVPVG